MQSSKPIRFDYHSAWTFFIITYGLSWGCWIPAALSVEGLPSFPVALLFYLGGLGPMLAACLAHIWRNRPHHEEA